MFEPQRCQSAGGTALTYSLGKFIRPSGLTFCLSERGLVLFVFLLFLVSARVMKPFKKSSYRSDGKRIKTGDNDGSRI